MTSAGGGTGGAASMIVVVGYDGSGASARAANYSVTLAARHRGHLLAVEVFDPKSSLGWAPLAATGDADVLAALREATRQDFAEIVGDIPAEEVERGEDGSERDDEDEQDEEQDDEEYEAGVHGEVVVQGWSATVIERSSNAQSLANRSVARLGAARGRQRIRVRSWFVRIPTADS